MISYVENTLFFGTEPLIDVLLSLGLSFSSMVEFSHSLVERWNIGGVSLQDFGKTSEVKPENLI